MHWGRITGLAAALAGTACLNDPSAPATYRLEVRPDTLRFSALRDTLRPLVVERHGSAGAEPLGIGTYDILDTGVATTSISGLITSRGVGSTRFVVRSPHGATDTAVVLVSQTVAALHPLQDTVTIESLEAQAPIPVVAVDPLGSVVQGAQLQYAVQDTTIAAVSAPGEIRARANGTTNVTVRGSNQVVTIVVRVSQRVMRITTVGDTIRFSALGQAMAVSAQPVDSLGYPVTRAITTVSVADTSVVVADGPLLRSRRTGWTPVRLEAGGVSSDQVAVVAQVPARIAVEFPDTQAILSTFQDSLIPVACHVLDANGFATPEAPLVSASSAGHWSGSTCDNLRARSSGFDTLRLAYDSLSASVPVVLAVRPILGPVTALQVDQMPPNVSVWAPSARRNSAGQIEVYFAGYTTIADSLGEQPGDLYRLVSTDGQQFLYDGVVLTHDSDACDLNGSGIENIAIAPRSDGPGWRMFYSGGSFGCYGWQVFSAVSTDERNWTREPGVRVSNGGPLPPAAPVTPPWPAGEGIVTDQLPDGTWRMTVGAYEPLTPAEDKFQITEWHSSDQLQWSYVRSLVTTRQLPAEGQRSVYSPTLSEVAPGLWRMIFTADDLNRPGGRSRLWSAVSTDRITWQVEGQILGAPGVQYFYSAVVGDRLFSVMAPQAPATWSTTLVELNVAQP